MRVGKTLKVLNKFQNDNTTAINFSPFFSNDTHKIVAKGISLHASIG